MRGAVHRPRPAAGAAVWGVGLAAAGLVLAAAGARSQAVSLDEGVFRIELGGREAGRETFSIRQSGTGGDAVIIAQGRIVLDGERGREEVATSLEVSAEGLRPRAYQATVRDTEPLRIAARIAGGRVSARVMSPAGEMMREYLASEGAVLMDEGVAHHAYFLARRIESGAARIPILVPRRSRQVSAVVRVSGPEPVEVAGERLEARRIEVESAGGELVRVWADPQGRVLRVEVPARGYVASRTAPPR